MDEKELGLAYGMCFKASADIVGKQDLSELSVGEIADEIVTLADALVDAAVAGQERARLAYSHLLKKTTSKSSPRQSGGYSKRGSSSGSSSVKPKDPNKPASDKQVALAQRLFFEKDHDLDLDPDSFGDLSMGEIGSIIEELISLPS